MRRAGLLGWEQQLLNLAGGKSQKGREEGRGIFTAFMEGRAPPAGDRAGAALLNEFGWREKAKAKLRQCGASTVDLVDVYGKASTAEAVDLESTCMRWSSPLRLQLQEPGSRSWQKRGTLLCWAQQTLL